MRRRLLRSGAFIRAARKVLKKNSQLVQDLSTALEMLEQDAFNPVLRRLEGTWACSAGYDLRILFRFVRYKTWPAA